MLSHRFDDALTFAARAHQHQRRKGTQIPYISHLMSVSALVLEHGGDEDQAIAALLHDAVEDQGGLDMRDTIKTRFGPRIAGIVMECSDSDGDGTCPWQVRKTAYIASIATKSDDAILVTACDKLHNATAILTDLNAIGPAVFERFTAKKDGTLWYYRTLADALSLRCPASLAQRLTDTVSRIGHAATA